MNSRGRGAMTSWRYNALPFSEDHNKTEGSLEDTATSPGKKGDLSMLMERSLGMLKILELKGDCFYIQNHL
jgi:hypothetical protein